MANEARQRKKRKCEEYAAGKIKRICMRNFMCHDALEVIFNGNVNFIIGRNGSGKSAILTALTVGLGARAHTTSRGASLKEFIKKGRNTAKIEITIGNEGTMAFKTDLYGNAITICRTIGASSTYRIKNSTGTIISTKREELNSILGALNIQIDNPISILNQDVSRTFLLSSKPKDRYQLFMRATRLDEIGENYKEAQIACKEGSEQLKHANQILSETREMIMQLKENIKRLEEVDSMREEMKSLEKELQWSMAISEEQKLELAEKDLKESEDGFKSQQTFESRMDSRTMEINNSIQELENNIQEAEQEAHSAFTAYNNAKKNYHTKKESFSMKQQELNTSESRVKRFKSNIEQLCKEIQRLEGNNNDGDKQHLTELEQKLDEVQAMLRTKQTDQMQLEANDIRLSKEMQSSEIERVNITNRIGKIKQDLSQLKKQSDNAFTVFGPNIPRLLKRIDEEHGRRRFKRKPCGPIGAYMKVKDRAWIPAVESYLGPGFLNTFCVDNSQDAKIVKEIMKDVFFNDKAPQVIVSKFFDKVHDVKQHSTHSNNYYNLLEAMEISNPVVANCLIDQREVECVLLIPTSQKASEIMSDASKVPRNCKKAITQQADIFHPDPHYRSYGGHPGLRAKFLQVSTREAIQMFEEEINSLEKERETCVDSCKSIREKAQRTKKELTDVAGYVSKLCSKQKALKLEIHNLKDKIDMSEGMLVSEHRDEIGKLEKRMEDEQEKQKALNEEITDIQKNIKTLEMELNKLSELKQKLGTQVDPLKDEIHKLKNEKQLLRMKGEQAARKLQAANKALENAKVMYKKQKETTEEVVANAALLCERIDRNRSANDITKLHKNLQAQVNEVERQLGNKEKLYATLKNKETKHGKLIDFANKLEESTEKHKKRLRYRREIYRELKTKVDLTVKASFASLLKLRNYKGALKINHDQRELELEVYPENNAKRTNVSTKSLSGGERSYSTVAFLLSLWECTNLPFYFLDEFDVFMDEVNRQIIMDILLEHTKTHPESQFAFLTPLDTSHIFAEDYVTIHRLKAPERSSQADAP